MKEIKNQQVLSFIEYVKETEAAEVFTEFMKEVDQCDDVENSNLTMLLEKAKKDSPGAAERAAVEQAMCDGVMYHCNS